VTTDTKDMLRILLKDKHLVMASQTEPYTHVHEDGVVKLRTGTGGVVTALDPLMAFNKGTWVSVGVGKADKKAVDREGKVRVPDENGYSLRRIWLTKQERDGYLDGVSNGALWPLCHMAYVRPRFVDAEWEEFKKVNRKFASAIAKECKQNSLVWIHDFQLCMVPKYLKKMRPEITTAFFWHIPWPNPQVFSICPWSNEILESLLCNDLMGFHTQQYAFNFLDSVDTSLEARVDRPSLAVYHRKTPTFVRSNPISIDGESVKRLAGLPPSEYVKNLLAENALDSMEFAIGVDRMDYTKGLPEKIKAMDAFFALYPKYIGKFSLLQIASPTRVHQPAYQKAASDVTRLTNEVNEKYRGKAKHNPKWKPIVLVLKQIDRADVYSLYSMARLCMVTSLHDGLNLVSKEFVASRAKRDGALILSKFTGAANELAGANLVNPYSVEEIVKAMHFVLTQSPREQARDMALLSHQVAESDVFAWSFNFLKELQAAHMMRRVA